MSRVLLLFVVIVSEVRRARNYQLISTARGLERHAVRDDAVVGPHPDQRPGGGQRPGPALTGTLVVPAPG